jgi:aminotransferase EvaB
MKIPFSYLPEQFHNTNIYFKEWKKLIKSCEFTLGPYIEKFEKRFAKYIGAKYCISTNNGTDALILCLKSIGVTTGDEVITVCNTFYATVGAIVACGAKPIFVDCDSRFQINANQIERVITKKTKAILPVHWGGASPDMTKIVKIAKKNKIKIIEDACMSIGAKIKNKRPGTFGHVNAFSMHPLKSLNVMGDGGAVVTNDKNLFTWMKKYRNHGMIDRDRIDFWGVNMRLQPLQAIVADIELNNIEKVIKKRTINAKILDNHLKKIKEIKIPPRVSGFKETYSLYMASFKKRNQLIKFLKKKGIEAKIHYPIPLHLQKASKIFGYKKNDFPISEKQSKEIVTLPVHQYLSKKHLNYMIKIINDFYKYQK